MTERCVFALGGEGLVLTEIAPGFDLQTDILDLMDFRPRVASNLQSMDTRIFEDRPMQIIGELVSLSHT